MRNKITIMEKNGLTAALGIVYLEEATIMTSFDPRSNNITKVVAPYGDDRARSFESQIQVSVDNGWKSIFEGRSFEGDVKLN